MGLRVVVGMRLVGLCKSLVHVVSFRLIMHWLVGCDFSNSGFMFYMYWSLFRWFITVLFCGVRGGRWYPWPKPLLASVSTVGKTRLVVVADQGAPASTSSVPAAAIHASVSTTD